MNRRQAITTGSAAIAAMALPRPATATTTVAPVVESPSARLLELWQAKRAASARFDAWIEGNRKKTNDHSKEPPGYPRILMEEASKAMGNFMREPALKRADVKLKCEVARDSFPWLDDLQWQNGDRDDVLAGLLADLEQIMEGSL
jgi:hypothetical protein